MKLDTTPGVARLTPANLQRVVMDMEAEPGWISAASLYSWYAGMCQESGVTPVSKKAFGTSLGMLGYKASAQRRNGTIERGWFLSRRAWRGEDNPAST